MERKDKMRKTWQKPEINKSYNQEELEEEMHNKDLRVHGESSYIQTVYKHHNA